MRRAGGETETRSQEGTMRGKPVRESPPSNDSNEAEKAARGAWIDKRRRYNRLYMRRWRANPAHEALERASRRQQYIERKRREAAAKARFTNDRGEAVCGICGVNPPVTVVPRLVVSESSPDGYLEVRVPYCGEC